MLLVTFNREWLQAVHQKILAHMWEGGCHGWLSIQEEEAKYIALLSRPTVCVWHLVMHIRNFLPVSKNSTN